MNSYKNVSTLKAKLILQLLTLAIFGTLRYFSSFHFLIHKYEPSSQNSRVQDSRVKDGENGI